MMALEERLFRKRRKFPVLAVLLLILGLVWLFNDMKVISVDLPWIPVVLIVVAVALIWNRMTK